MHTCHTFDKHLEAAQNRYCDALLVDSAEAINQAIFRETEIRVQTIACGVK